MSIPIFTNTLTLPADITNLLAGQCDLHLWQGEQSDSQLLKMVTGYLMYGHYKINGSQMDLMPNLRVISNFGVGVDHINVADAKVRGIAVGNTPNLLDGTVADMTFALMLAAARNIVTGDHFARSSAFTHYDPTVMNGLDVHSTTLGIIGMGNIGQQVARRALAFDMRVLYHNRKRNPQAETDYAATYCMLPDLLRQADFVVLTTPLTPETRGIIGREELRMMKPTSILVNIARGGVVDHDALTEALREKWIHAAAIDVTEPEPLPRDHPLLSFDNLVITPHLGSAARQTRLKMAQRTVDNLWAGMRGEALLSAV